jgi:D-alanyl-D-alanine carboxypeptidase
MRRAERLTALKVKAKALYCVDYSSNTVLLAKNVDEPLPIASITKLLTAMTVLDSMELDRVVKVGSFVKSVEPKKVGIRPGDLLTVRDLLHGMLIESGNDCAEVLANAYQGGRSAFIKAMNRKAQALGANSTRVFTPSGLDSPLVLGKKNGSLVVTKKFNQATAADVALIARNALQYPLISKISGKKSHRMTTRNTRKRTYRLRSNDRLLHRPLPVAVAKTGYTSLAGRCIVALFKDAKTEHVVVVLNSPHHFKAAERIYRWARTLN